MTEVRRINPEDGFVREFTEFRDRVKSLETAPAGNIVIRETLTTEDPETGVKTTIGQLPDGSYGFQPFIGDIVPPPVATTPVVSAQPGSVVVSWDGLFVGNEEKPRDFQHVNVIAHNIMAGNTIISLEVGVLRLSSESVIVTTDVVFPGETWEFSLESEDYNGNRAALSARSATVTVLGYVDDSGVAEAIDNLNQTIEAAQQAADDAQGAAQSAQEDADAAAASALAAANLAGSKGVVYTQSTTPSADYSGLWIDTAHNNIPRRFLGVRSALVMNVGGGASIGTRLSSLGWAVSAVTTTPSLEDAAKYDLVAMDAGYAGLLASPRDLAEQLHARGVSLFTTGNDSTAMPPLFTGSTNRSTPKNAIRYVSAGSDGPSAYTDYGDTDLNLYLTGVNPSAKVTGVTLAASTGTDQPINLIIEHPTNFSRWAHVETYATPASVLNAHLGWISNNWVAIQDQGVIDAAKAAAAAQTKADQAFNNAATAASAAGDAQTSADSKNTVWYQDDQPAGIGHKIGDTWFDTNDNYKTSTWNGSIWQTTQDSWAAQQTADSKGITYTQSVTPPVSARLPQNLWNDTSLGEDKVVVKYWSTVANAWTALADKTATEARTVADSKGETIFSSTEPTVAQRLTQNLWVDTTGGVNINKRWNGSGWVVVADTRIASTATAVTAADAKAQNALNEAIAKSTIYTQNFVPPVEARLPQTIWNDTTLGLDKVVVKYWSTTAGAWTALADKEATEARVVADSKGETIYSDAEPAVAKRLTQNLWIDTTGGINLNKRWNGSGWVTVVDTRIPATASAVTAADAKAQTAVDDAATKSIVYTQSTTPPVSARLPQTLWNDTSLGLSNVVVKYWDGDSWEPLADKAATDAAAVANSKGETIFSDSEPAVAKRLAQNLWVDTTGGINLHKRWTGATWAVVADSRIAATASQLSALTSQVSAVSAQADRSITTFYGTSAPSAPESGDLWLTGVAGEPMKRYNGSAWLAFEDPNVQAAYEKAGDAQSAADAKVRTFAQTDEPTGMVPNDIGDLWIDTNDNNKLWRYSGAAWVAVQDGDIAVAQEQANTALSTASAAVTAAQGAQTTADGKNTSYYQNDQPTGGTYKVGDLWFDTNDNYKMRTFAGGSTWQLTQDSAGAQAAAISAAAADATAKASAAQAAAIADADAKVDLLWKSARAYLNDATSADGIVGTGPMPIVVTSDTAVAGKAFQTSGQAYWVDTNSKQAFDPTSLYRVRARVRMTTDSTGKFYLGFAGYAADGVTYSNSSGVNAVSGQHWALNAQSVAPSGVWTEFEGFVQGYVASGGSAPSNGGILNPMKLHTGTKYVAPIMIVDYAGTTGVWEISHFSVDVVDATGHQAIVDAQTAKAEAIAAAAADATSKANAAQAAAISAAATDAAAKADAAEEAAIIAAGLDATAKAEAAEAAATAAAAIDAQAKADAAEQAAIDAAAITAQLIANGAEQSAIDAAALDAEAKADAAEAAAIAAAAADATAKAEQAEADAIAAAAIDAQTRATQAKADAQAAAALDATAKADAAQRAAIQAQAYSLNPSFEDWTGTIPASYTTFVTNPTKETTTVRTGKNAVRFNCTDATTQRGLQFNAALAHAPYFEYLTVELDVRLDSGTTFGGSGVLVDWGGMTGGNRVTLSLASEIPAPVTGRWYRVVKVIRKPATAVGTFSSYSAWLMGQYSGGMGTMSVKNVIFDWINVRPATTEEVTAYGLPASVSALSETVNTKTKSWFQPSPPPLTGNTTGDLWFDTDDGNKIHIWNGAWTVAQDQQISSLNTAVTAAQASANGKNKVIYSTNPATGTTGYVAGDTWFQRDGSNNIIGQWEFTTSWQSRALDNAVIANLNAAKLIAGYLNADRIEAGSLTANKIAIGDFTNLVDNGTFETDFKGWTVNGGATITTTDPYSGTKSAVLSGGQSIVQDRGISVTPGEKLHVSIYYKASADKAGPGGLRIRNQLGAEGVTWSGGYDVGTATTWTLLSGIATVNAGTTVIYPRLGFALSAGSVQFDNYVIRRMTNATLIEDGTITTNSAIIAEGAIGNAHIGNAAVDTAEIKDAAITEAKIENLAVTNAKIEDATIEHGKIATLDAGKITVGLLEGWQIKANAIDASKLNVTLGGSNLVSNSSFEADTDANGLADDWSVWTRGSGDAGRVFTNARVAGHFPGSTFAQKVTSTTVTNTEQSSIQATTLFSISPATSATISLYGRASVAGNFSISVRCENDAGAYMGDASFIAAFTTSAQRFIGTVITPAGTTRGKITITTPNSLSNGHWFEVDGVQAELGNVASSWGPKTEELLPGTIKAGMLAADSVTATSISVTALNGKTITGSTIQTEVTASRGIKLTSTELAGYDNAGVKNFSLTSLGALTLRGALQTGSSIEGATVTGTTGIQTSGTALRGVKITNTGVSAFDGSGNMTFRVDSATGVVEAPGIKANSIKGDKIEAGTVSADKLLISDFTNLLDDPSLVGPGWIKGANPNNATIIFDSNEKTNVWRLAALGQQVDVTNSNVIPVKSTDRFLLDARTYSTLNASGYLRVMFLTETMALVSPNGIVDLTIPTNANTWTARQMEIIPPAAARFMKIQPIIGATATTGTILYGSMTLRRRFGGELIVDGAINGQTITGATITGGLIQSEVTANRGVKLTSTELSGYDNTGVKNFSLTSLGALVIRGTIESGSTIKGATLAAAGGGIETTTTANRGVKLKDTGITTYDSSGNMTFKVDAATGLVEAPGLKANSITGGMIAGSTITAKNLFVGDFANLATIDEVNGITISSYGQTMVSAGYNKLVTDSGSFFMFTDQRGPVPFVAGDTLYFEFTAKATAATTAVLGVWTYDGVGNLSTSGPTINIGTTDTLIKKEMVVTNVIADAKTFVLGLQSVANKGIQVKGVKVYKKFGGNLIVDGAIDGKIITGATIQTVNTVDRGIKLTDTELAGFDVNGLKNFSLTSAGALIVKGTIKSGSSIEGASLAAGGGGIETTTTPARGVKLQNSGITTYDSSGNMTFKVDATTGLVQAPGIEANSISGDKISAKSLSVDKMMVADFNNYLENPSFETGNLNGWTAVGGWSVNTASPYDGTYKALTQYNGATQSLTNKMEIVLPADGKVRVRFRLYSEGPTSGVQTGLALYNVVGGALESVTNVVGAGQWVEIDRVLTAATAGAKRLQIFTTGVGAGYVRLDAITMNKMENGSLIVDGAIKTDHMTVGTIDGGIISAGTITTPLLKAKSVTIDKLLVTSTDNIVQEGNFSGSGASWDLPTNFAIGAAAGRNSLPAMVITNTASLQTSWNAVGAPTKTAIEYQSEGKSAYRVSAWVRSTVTVPVSGAYVTARFKSSTGATTPSNVVYTTGTPAVAATIPANTWTQITGLVTAPDDNISVAFSVNSAATLSTGTLTWDTVAVTRASNGELIVDGSITASSIKAGAITIGTVTGLQTKVDTFDGTTTKVTSWAAGDSIDATKLANAVPVASIPQLSTSKITNLDANLSTLTADAQTAMLATAYSKNPSFDQWTGTYPVDYATWGSVVPTKDITNKRVGAHGMAFNVTASGTQAGAVGNSIITHMPNSQYVTVELEFMLTSGTLAGAGVLVDWTGMANNRATISLATEVPSPTLNKWHRATVTVARPSNATGTWTAMQTYLMANYSSIGAAVKNIVFDWYNVRPATEQEVDALLAKQKTDQWQDGSGNLKASEVAGTLADANIPSLGTSKIVGLDGKITTYDANNSQLINWTRTGTTSIDGGQIYTDSILADAIGANQIVTDHMQAGSINADRLEIESITSTQISASAITAEKLESELVLATRIVAGDPDGTFAEMSPQGFRVFADGVDGAPSQEVVRLGVAATNDFFAITKSDGSVAATISDGGVGSFAKLSVPAYDASTETISDITDLPEYGTGSGGLWYNGDEFQTHLNQGRLIARAYRNTFSAFNANNGQHQPYCRLDRVFLKAGNLYRISTGPVRMDHDAGTNGYMTIWMNTSTTNQSIAANIGTPSTAIAETVSDSGPARTSDMSMGLVAPLEDCWASFLFSFSSQGPGAVGIRSSSAAPFRMLVENLGRDVGTSGIYMDGTNPPPPAVNTYQKQYTSSAIRSFDGNNNTYNFDTGRMYQGLSPAGYGNLKSISIQNNMTTDLTNATINWMRVYFQFDHWYYNSGGTARVGVHGHTGLPSSFTGTGSATFSSGGIPKPGDRWIDIPSTFWNGFKTGQYRGVLLEGDGSYGTYGYARPPVIEINYTK